MTNELRRLPVLRLPYRSLARPLCVRRRYVRQTNCMGQFADLTLSLRPTDHFDVRCEPPPPEILPPELFEGVREALTRPRKNTELFAGLRVAVIAALIHPIDSRPLSFQLATLLALDEAFEEAGILRLGRDFCSPVSRGR